MRCIDAVSIRMKWLFLIAIAARTVSALEPLLDYWRFESGNLYYIDWSKRGYPEGKKEEILRTIPKRIGRPNAPFEVLLGNWGPREPIKGKPIYQAAVSIKYRNNATKEIKTVLIWVGRDCELEYFGGNRSKQDSLLAWIKKAASESMRAKVLNSKKCIEALHRSAAGPSGLFRPVPPAKGQFRLATRSSREDDWILPLLYRFGGGVEL